MLLAGHHLQHLPPAVPTLSLGVLVALILVLTAVLSRLLRAPASPRVSNVAAARAVHDRFGRSSIDPFALMDDKTHFWSSDGAAFLAYSVRAGMAVIAGSGIGPPRSLQLLREEFELACRRSTLRPVYYQVGADTAAGGIRVIAGEEAIVELRSWSLSGHRMARLRHEVARARRHGVITEVRPAAEIDGPTRREVEELAELSTARRRPKQAAFSFGSLDLPPHADTVAGLARDSQGRLVAAATCVRVPARKRVVVDQVYRAPAAPPGTVDLLLSNLLEHLRTTTDEVSLGLVPPRGWERVMHALSLVGACTTSPGHRLFKAKFRPRWESRYVVVRSFFDLPAAAVALFLVHHRPGRPEGSGSNELVGGPGFEPGTSRSRTERAAGLR